MNTWLAILLVLVPALIGIYPGIKKLWHFLLSRLTYADLSIHALRPKGPKGSTQEVTLKVAYVGDRKLIIEDLSVGSKLHYLSGVERILAWLRLGLGYFKDDVDGLQTVLSDWFPPTTWTVGGPVNTISRSFIRKPISFLLGLLTLYFFIAYLVFPPCWLLISIGPYVEFRLMARNERVRLTTSNRDSVFTPPFILDPGIERMFTLSYEPSLVASGFGGVGLKKNPKIEYVSQPPKVGPFRLPRPGQFVWRSQDSLRVRVKGRWREYPVDIGTSYVSVLLA